MKEALVWLEQFQAQLVAKPNLSPAQIAADLDLLFTNPELLQLSFSALVKRLIESPIWQEFDYDNNPYKALCLQLSNVSGVRHSLLPFYISIQSKPPLNTLPNRASEQNLQVLSLIHI